MFSIAWKSSVQIEQLAEGSEVELWTWLAWFSCVSDAGGCMLWLFEGGISFSFSSMMGGGTFGVGYMYFVGNPRIGELLWLVN